MMSVEKKDVITQGVSQLSLELSPTAHCGRAESNSRLLYNQIGLVVQRSDRCTFRNGPSTEPICFAALIVKDPTTSIPNEFNYF